MSTQNINPSASLKNNFSIKYSAITKGRVLKSNEGAKKCITVSTLPGYQCVRAS